MKSMRGFTVVELLIVILVISILAGIAVVSYTSVQDRAKNTNRLAQLKQWEKIFRDYRAKNGEYPPAPLSKPTNYNGYCLGTGFPKGWDGTPRCRDYLYNAGGSSQDTSYKESDSAPIMTALKTVSPNLPGGPYEPVNGTVGPYVNYWPSDLRLIGVFKGKANECPEGTTYNWDDKAGLLMCDIVLNLP